MDLMALRRALLGGNCCKPIPQIVLQYTLDHDITENVTVLLDTIESDELQAFFNAYIGVRGSFPVGTYKMLHIDVSSDVTPSTD